MCASSNDRVSHHLRAFMDSSSLSREEMPLLSARTRLRTAHLYSSGAATRPWTSLAIGWFLPFISRPLPQSTVLPVQKGQWNWNPPLERRFSNARGWPWSERGQVQGQACEFPWTQVRPSSALIIACTISLNDRWVSVYRHWSLSSHRRALLWAATPQRPKSADTGGQGHRSRRRAD